MIKKIFRSDGEWKEILDPEVFAITRGSGTEPTFHNEYWNNEEEGKYDCSNCDLTLFSSKDKFDSGTGWPSFTHPILADHVEAKEDASYNMFRIEALCACCGSHLGHVFDDLPAGRQVALGPNALRYCINSAALKFVKKL